jgi:hypothetical protein
MLAVAMEESGIAELVNTAQINGRTWYSFESASADVCSVVGSQIGRGLERAKREVLEGILADA